MNVCVIGAGYVGLVTGFGFASFGHKVLCVDTNAAVIERLSKGEVHFFEPGAAEHLKACRKAGTIAFSQSLQEGLETSDIVVVAVGTPQLDTGQADVSSVFACCEAVARLSRTGKTVVVKSTVPVGTCDLLRDAMQAIAPGLRFPVVSNPEFLREGSAFDDFFAPDRIVIGGDDAAACRAVAGLYAKLAEKGVPILTTDARTSELIKYAANSFLATKVAFINEIANLCDAVGADVDVLARAIGADPRIGPAFLKPGPGYGGSCFPKDTLALTVQAREADSPIRIVEAVVASNAYHIRRLPRRIAAAMLQAEGFPGRTITGRALAGRRIAVLGLTFKADTDDMRAAASLVIVPQLQKLGAEIRAYDPIAAATARDHFPGLDFFHDWRQAIAGADLALILTEHREIAEIDWRAASKEMRRARVFDTRNLYRPETMLRAGIDYISLGRPSCDGLQEAFAVAGRAAE